MGRVTRKQKLVAERICQQLDDNCLAVREEVRANIKKENEYMEKKIKAQTPTRESRQRPFNI